MLALLLRGVRKDPVTRRMLIILAMYPVFTLVTTLAQVLLLRSLREGGLTKELLRLYFTNFSDIHFLFDEEHFLREFDLGEIRQVVLFAMMALGIK